MCFGFVFWLSVRVCVTLKQQSNKCSSRHESSRPRLGEVMSSPLSTAFWTGRLCVGGDCFSAAEIDRSRLDWRGLLRRAEPNLKDLSPCGTRRNTKDRCRPLALDPWPLCDR